jgi:hypothetical protein
LRLLSGVSLPSIGLPAPRPPSSGDQSRCRTGRPARP